MYPKNNASPERLAIGQVILISDGTVQTSGVSIVVRGQGGAEGAGGGTTAYGADGTVYYTPTQAETNYTSFVVIAYKASCFSASQTVITTASSTAGQVDVKSIAGTAQTANDNGADINAILTDTADMQPRVAAIETDTNELQSDWVNGGRLDLILDIIAADTTTDIPALIATAQTDLDTITGANGVLIDDTESAALVDEIWDEPIAGHLTAGTVGLSEALGSAAIIDTTATGTPTSTTVVLTAGSTIDNFYNDQLLYILSGTGVGQVRVVTDYVGATKTVTVDEPFIVTPVATDRIAILVQHVHSISQIAGEVLTTQMTESYAADGTAPTLAQALFLIQQSVGDFSITGTTITTYELDGTTPAATYTLDSATVPTSRTRSS